VKLFLIAAEYRAIADALEASDGDNVAEMEAAFAATCDELQVKATAIVGLIRELQTEADAIKAEAARIAKLASAKQNAADRLKHYLLQCLQAAEIQRLDVGIAKLSVQRAPRPSISWETGADIPEPFQRVKVELDGAKTFAAFQDGTLPASFTVKHTTFLSVR